MEEYVELICVKSGGKLRVRITSRHYLHDANVQFPKAIREENRRYRVKTCNIGLISTRGKYFYSVKKANTIEILYEGVVDATHQIFQDEDNAECVICMSVPKNVVFVPCYHYYCCTECSKIIVNCPICRIKITNKINKDMIG